MRLPIGRVYDVCLRNAKIVYALDAYSHVAVDRTGTNRELPRFKKASGSGC
jgi:hypothetical protein